MDSLVFYRHTLPMVAANVNMVKKATAYYRPSTLHFRMNNIRIILILITGYATPPFTHPLHSLNKSAKDQHLLKQIVIITNSMGISKKKKNTWGQLINLKVYFTPIRCTCTAALVWCCDLEVFEICLSFIWYISNFIYPKSLLSSQGQPWAQLISLTKRKSQVCKYCL